MTSLPRFCAVVFAFWAAVFVLAPGWANNLGALNYLPSQHAEDWTRIVGLLSLGFAVLLNDVHRSGDPAAQRLVAGGLLAFALPCAVLMTYWQLIPDRRWIRLDILNIILLYLISYFSFLMRRQGATRPPGSPSPAPS